MNLIHFPADAIRLLIEGKRPLAEAALGLALPNEFPTADDLAGFLPIQLKRMEESPGRLDWTARLMVMRDGGTPVGHCGFHGPPEVIGRAEIGYTVFTPYRSRGLAKEAARALVEWALDQGERPVFATVSPANAPSLAVVRALGFVEVGVQQDEVDGTELVFAVERLAGSRT